MEISPMMDRHNASIEKSQVWSTVWIHLTPRPNYGGGILERRFHSEKTSKAYLTVYLLLSACIWLRSLKHDPGCWAAVPWNSVSKAFGTHCQEESCCTIWQETATISLPVSSWRFCYPSPLALQGDTNRIRLLKWWITPSVRWCVI